MDSITEACALQSVWNTFLPSLFYRELVKFRKKGEINMNVMIAAYYSAPKSGNFISSIIALGRLIRQKGGTVVYVFPEERDWAKWIREEGFEVVAVGSQSLEEDRQLIVLQTLIKKYQTELLHLHFGIFHHAIIHDRKAIKDVNIIVHDHMGFSVQTDMKKQYIVSAVRSLEYSLKKINLIAVQKKKTASYIFLRNKWFIPNGLSLERYIKYPTTCEECRQTFGIKPSEKICLILGWDMKRKGFDVALKAIKKCREIDSNIVLGIIGVGRGAPSDAAKEFMKNETPDIDPYEGWIKYLDDYEDIFTVFKAVDVYLMTSRKEGMPYSVLEAISQETPTVISDIQENRFAKGYNNSYFYSVEDSDACAKAVMNALQVGRIKTNSQRVIKKYGIEKWCQDVLKVYDVVMSQ